MLTKVTSTLIVLSILAPFASAQDGGAAYRRLLEEKGPAVVTVRFMLNVKMGGMMAGAGDQEAETEISGVLVDPRGVVLCSSTQLEGPAGVMRRMMPPGVNASIMATPTDFEVLVGDDVDGLEAELIARDSELDLAWVRIVDFGGKVFPHVDLSRAAEARVGMRLLTLWRMGEYYDRQRIVGEGRIGGILEKPRRLFVPAAAVGTGMGSFGLPAFAEDGAVVGVFVMQTPDTAQDAGAMLGSLSRLEESTSAMLLPAADVARATARALEQMEE